MKIKVGISGDLLNSNGIPCFGNKALSKIKTRSDIEIIWMDKSIKEITEEMASKFDAILLNIPKASAKSVSRDDCKLKIISRFGVGYDSVDIEAMKEKGIVVTNTPNAVRRPVAVAALTMMFALSGKLLKKNDLVRAGQWNDRTNFMGMGLTQKTLGIVGAGSIGQETIKLSQPFFKKIIAFDPFLTKEELHSKGILKTDLIELAKSSDIIVVLCNLNKSTQGMINNKFFSNMKKTSYIINLSRGSVINEKDLELALENEMIAGAGLDVTSVEPLSPNSKLMSFENVILTPHSLCWTDECFHNIATEAINSILNFFDGTKLENQVNK
tara:strand:+ start:654 stop:1634 length:981 start_codon:yes stop_codon:yes gene_type:complete